jgi:hypothetical protein
VTSGTSGSTGALNQAGTSVLVGGPLSSDQLNGGRVTAGYWIVNDYGIALEGSAFGLEQDAHHFLFTSTGDPTTAVLARPFFDAASGTQSSSEVAIPGLFSGSVAVDLRTRLFGGEVNLTSGGIGCDGWCWHVLAGARYLDLKDRLDITQSSAPLVAGSAASSQLTDEFKTLNRFYGGQIGVEAEVRGDAWILSLRGTAAFGNTHESLTMNGSTTINDPVLGTVVLPGNLLVQPNNIGHFSRNKFAVAPEVRLRLGIQLTPHWTGEIGYTFLYLSDAARAGDQVTTVVNNPVPSQPTFFFQKDRDFWAQGLTAGLTFRY